MKMLRSCTCWKKYECLLTSGCYSNTSSKMTNLVMLEWFIDNMCQIAIIWEAVIINSRKPLKSMVFCVLYNRLHWASRNLLYPDEMTHLTFMPEHSITCSFERFCSIRGHNNLRDIPCLFINFANIRFGQWLCIGKSHFLSQTTDFASFVAKLKFIGLLSTKPNIRSGNHWKFYRFHLLFKIR